MMNPISGARRLQTIRFAIDAADLRILSLISRRARLAMKAGRVKKLLGLPVLDRARERHILARIKAMGAGPLRRQDVDAIFRRLISACRRLE